ncbi:DUF3037 domain-containing protein [soil metagenome]
MSPESPAEWYSYAVVRVVPRVERGEFVNAGVVLFAPVSGLLCARATLDRDRVRALDNDADLDEIEMHLRLYQDICEGNLAGGPIAELPASERFHWLTAPRSTVIQVSQVHEGWSTDLRATFERLVEQYVVRAH